MFNSKVKCITCDKEIPKKEAKKQFDVYFCSEKCLADYEEHLKNIDKDFTLDKCC
jgi:endogenous inhibitor of DNA gyrase (YacG/DUF329 family)